MQSPATWWLYLRTSYPSKRTTWSSRKLVQMRFVCLSYSQGRVSLDTNHLSLGNNYVSQLSCLSHVSFLLRLSPHPLSSRQPGIYSIFLHSWTFLVYIFRNVLEKYTHLFKINKINKHAFEKMKKQNLKSSVCAEVNPLIMRKHPQPLVCTALMMETSFPSYTIFRFSILQGNIEQDYLYMKS